LVFAEYPMGGEALKIRAVVLIGTDKSGRGFFESGH
jgi:hypothetical protein